MRKKLVLASILLFALLFGWFLWQQHAFRLTSFVPGENGPEFTKFVWTFNKPLDEQRRPALTTNPQIKGEFDIKNNRIVLTPVSSLPLGAYELRLSGVFSGRGQAIGTIVKTVKIEYIPENRLSGEERKFAQEATDIFDGTDPFLAALPYQTLHFKVELVNNVEGKLSVLVTTYAALNRQEQLESYKKDTAAYQKEALDWIRSNGRDLSTLHITYQPTL